MLYCYNGINFLQNIQERYSASVPAMMSAILCYIRPCYNGTQLHWPYTLISHWVDWDQWNKCIHYLEKNPFSILKLKMCCHLPFIQKWYLQHNFYQYLLQSYALVDNNVSKCHVILALMTCQHTDFLVQKTSSIHTICICLTTTHVDMSWH